MLALLLRLIFILIGAALLDAFHITFYIFGVLLIYTAWKLARHSEGFDPTKLMNRLSARNVSPLLVVFAVIAITDIVFAVDSILVAVAMSPKMWVIISGGILGIVTMRMVIGQLLALVRRYPALVDGAFIIIAWVGFKLMIEYLHAEGWVHFQVNKWISFGLIVVIFGVAYLYARRQGPVSDAAEDEATALLNEP